MPGLTRPYLQLREAVVAQDGVHKTQHAQRLRSRGRAPRSLVRLQELRVALLGSSSSRSLVLVAPLGWLGVQHMVEVLEEACGVLRGVAVCLAGVTRATKVVQR